MRTMRHAVSTATTMAAERVLSLEKAIIHKIRKSIESGGALARLMIQDMVVNGQGRLVLLQSTYLLSR